ERRVRGEHELVPRGAARRIPGKRGRAGEGRRVFRVAGEEGVQAVRRCELRRPVVRGRADAGLRSTGESEHGQTDGSNTNERHTSWVFGSYEAAGVPRMRDDSSLPAARTSASSPGLPTNWTEAGRPSSAGPHGSANAGQPRALNGNVNWIARARSSRSPIPVGGATNASVGQSKRSMSARRSRVSER